jgi:uncharacterized protein (TIGR02246 family)
LFGPDRAGFISADLAQYRRVGGKGKAGGGYLLHASGHVQDSAVVSSTSAAGKRPQPATTVQCQHIVDRPYAGRVRSRESEMLRFAVIVVVGLVTLLVGCQTPGGHAGTADRIRQVLADQAAAWNRGDIPGYMQAYWHSDELSFSSGGKTTHGYAAAEAAYVHRYPTPERMGRLTFSELQVRMLCPEAALVLGRWQLDREPDPVGGNFSLVLRVIDGEWRIIHDHTSQLRE